MFPKETITASNIKSAQGNEDDNDDDGDGDGVLGVPNASFGSPTPCCPEALL